MSFQKSLKADIFTDFMSLSHNILIHANQGSPKLAFLRDISKLLLDFSLCDHIEIWLKDEEMIYRWSAGKDPHKDFNFEFIDNGKCKAGLKNSSSFNGEKDFLELCLGMLYLPKNNNGNHLKSKIYSFDGPQAKNSPEAQNKPGFPSNLFLPFEVSSKINGLLILMSSNKHYFTDEIIKFYEGMTKSLGIAIANRRAQAALKERIKELKCTYGICQTFNIPHLPLKGILKRTVNLLPPAMQYPEISSCRIVLDGKSYKSNGFKGKGMKLSSHIVINDEKRGFIEVIYGEGNFDLGPLRFLQEEKKLLDTISGNISLIIERKEAEEEKAKLTEQLRHADRLATLGQLAAGVAHEINEPLANILGFAQLVKKIDDMPNQADKDLNKIISSCLHAREIVKKLLIFARQMPTKKDMVDLNLLVEEVISFFESRLTKGGIGVHLCLANELPPIRADISQMRQLLTNLVVNAMHAMPRGGSLTITTKRKDDELSITVEDTGEGMSKRIMKQIFIPFFTTKEIGRGTGLGLPVVHGIVTSHSGTIEVDSKPGIGSRFKVLLPYNKVR